MAIPTKSIFERVRTAVDKKVQTTKNAVMNRWFNKPPKSNPVSEPTRDSMLDAWNADLSPTACTSAIQQALGGNPVDLIDLWDRVRRSDLILRGIIGTRLRAVKKCDWQIVPATNIPSLHVPKELAPQAEQAAKWCEQHLTQNARGFEDAVDHLADGPLYGVSVVEMVWSNNGTHHTVSAFKTVQHRSIWGDPNEPWRLRVATSEHDSTGVLIDDTPLQFAVHIPERIGPSPWGGALMVSGTMAAIIKHLGWRWYAKYCEKFGVPFIYGKYGTNASQADRTDLLNAVRTFGANAYGTFHSDTAIEVNDVAKSGDSLPQKSLIETINKDYAICVLGQELTTSTSSTGGGAYALGQVHEGVRKEIRDSDFKAESKTIRDQILTPMIRFGPMAGAPVPYFTRITPEVKDRKTAAEVLSIVINDLGQPVTFGQVSDATEIPLADGVDPNELAPGRATISTGFDLGGEGGMPQLSFESESSGGLRQLTFQAAAGVPGIPRPGANTSPHAILNNWVNQATRRAESHVEAVLSAMRAGLKLGDRTKTLNDTDAFNAAIQIDSLIDDLPTAELSRAMQSFLLASQLVGFLNGQRRTERRRATRYRAAVEDAANLIGPFEEAVKALTERVKLPADTFLKLDTAARNRAGRVATMMNARIVQAIYEKLEQIIAQGGTVQDFRDALKTTGSDRIAEWVGTKPSHTAQVFRQNAVMAYQAGHYEQMQSVGVNAYRWRSYGDSCEICREYVNKVFRADSTNPYPGGTHFGCDCWAEPVFDARIEDATDIRTVSNPRLTALQARPSALRYDPREFANVEQFDLSSVPARLRSSFERFVNGN